MGLVSTWSVLHIVYLTHLTVLPHQSRAPPDHRAVLVRRFPMEEPAPGLADAVEDVQDDARLVELRRAGPVGVDPRFDHRRPPQVAGEVSELSAAADED